jgi:outer membrane receptor protein involved in Fe transport
MRTETKILISKVRRGVVAGFLAVNGVVGGVAGAPGARAAALDDVVVTATRIAEPADAVPADVSVVSGKELVDRGASDMASALSLVPGVEAPAGGDAGPSSAVPAFWGLHEFDAFLLVVDGVPWGGAFNPGITTLDLNDVERIEVLKGSAPIMYGATSFVGVVHAIHYPAGEAANELDIAYGNYGSIKGSTSFVLPQVGDWRESFAADGESLGFADAREIVSNGHALYRGEGDLGPGTLRVDSDLTFVRDVPPSPVVRVGTGLTPLTPQNANFNPADAKIDEDKYHLSIGYSLPSAWGAWDTLASFAYSDVTDIRAFLHPDLSGAADTQNQRRYIDDGYFDTHLASKPSSHTTLIVGADLLYGHGQQTTLNGNSGYTVPLDGSVIPPPTSAVAINEIGTINDRRTFAGQYAQFEWQPDSRWDVTAGFRINEAEERKESSDLILPPSQLAEESVSKTMIRPSEVIGASYRLWAQGKDEVVAYADYRNAFKPSAIDFGPDYTPTLLSPETAQSYEAGLKGAADEGRFTYQAELFRLDFNNLVVATSSGALTNAGGERLEGIEAETRYHVTPDLVLAASASYHDARFTQYLFFDGVANVQVAGNQLPLSPHILAAAGLLYTPAQGFNATAVAQYVGRQFLDEQNIAPVGGYTTLAANLGYRVGRYRLLLEGNNLSNQRKPVSASEFGSESFYLLNARTLWVRITCSWR